ncbi:MAG: hypothetical protein EOP56_00440 [Sphingobacteriales bacterium]|nr:MAG: hypothetical protein EOP56_00440 [Sphingobacteriales bacterium]
MPATDKKNLDFIFFVALLLLGCIILYHHVIFLYPAYMHDWAQADRLSLAINFYDRGMNFFKPATHSLYSIDGITGVEFPIVSYLAAALGHIFGRGAISTCFRVLNIGITCLGLSFLFAAGYRITKSFWLSAFIPFFIFCAPVYSYYTSTYMPDSSGASVVFIGLYFMQQYLQKRDNRSLLSTIGLLTLATLMKTSTGIYCLGFLSLVFLQYTLQLKRHSLKQHLIIITSTVGAIAMIVGYYLYNNYLNEKYQSTLFLAKANPFDNIKHIKIFYYDFFLNVWMFEYFSQLQYVVLFTLVIPVHIFLTVRRLWEHLYLLVVFFVGAIAMLYLFGGQLFHHDYYIVSIVMPVIAFFLLIAVSLLNSYIPAGRLRLLPAAVIAVVCLSLFHYALADFTRRNDPVFLKKTFNVVEPVSWAAHGKELLGSLNIPKNEHIGVLNEESPNRALVYLDRRGYHIPGISWIYNVGMAKDIMIKNRLNVMVCSRKTCNYMREHDPEAYARFFVPVVIREDLAVFKLKPQN